MTDLLRDELGFNGMVVTDASHMVGMTNRMQRKDMLPAAINAGCDMFLFFNDPEEDYGFMLDAYNNGIISEARMTEALTRILGLKAAKGMHKKSLEELCGTDEAMTEALQNPEYKTIAPAISKAACIAAMLKFGYDPAKVIMIGDAPGDCDAAEKNGVYYYPILVNREKESWEEAVSVAFQKLQEGAYAPYGAQKKQEFLENLGG